MNKLSDTLSEISCNLDVKTKLSEDSEDVPMAFNFTTHGNFQAGADGGCLHCLDLVNKGKSYQKHTNGCPSKSTQKNESELHMTAGVIADAKSDDIPMLHQKKPN
jgi:hypothetical protein